MAEREPTFRLTNVEVAIGILEDEGYPKLSAAVERLQVAVKTVLDIKEGGVDYNHLTALREAINAKD